MKMLNLCNPLLSQIIAKAKKKKIIHSENIFPKIFLKNAFLLFSLTIAQEIIVSSSHGLLAPPTLNQLQHWEAANLKKIY